VLAGRTGSGAAAGATDAGGAGGSEDGGDADTGSIALGSAGAARRVWSTEVGWAPLDSWHPALATTSHAAPNPKNQAREWVTPLLYTAAAAKSQEIYP
jgi:hypothetical protein